MKNEKPKSDLLSPGPGANNPGGRCCANCAYVFVIEPPPEVLERGGTTAYVCRLNPPEVHMGARGGAIADGRGQQRQELIKSIHQRETLAHIVCSHHVARWPDAEVDPALN
jgi:hypothetical protein